MIDEYILGVLIFCVIAGIVGAAITAWIVGLGAYDDAPDSGEGGE